MPANNRPRRPRDDDEDDDDRDDAPRGKAAKPKKKPAPAKPADPERMYLYLGGGLVALLVLAGIGYFAVRPGKKPVAGAGGGAAGGNTGPSAADYVKGGAADVAKPQDVTTVTLSKFERTQTNDGGPAGRGKLTVHYAFNGGRYPVPGGKYVLVIETKRERKAFADKEPITEREGPLEFEGQGPVFLNVEAKVWLEYRVGEEKTGTIVSNTLIADAVPEEKDKEKGN